LDHLSDLAAALPVLSRALLVGLLCAAGLQPSLADDDPASCQDSGWNMSREFKAYAGKASRLSAGDAVRNAPVVRSDTLYALTLRSQSDVHFVQESPNAPRVSASMAGLARFTVLTAGRYRVTVDTALWIDAVDATTIVAPSNYITWHRCPRYRKSVEYRWLTGQSIVLQFSGATATEARVTIEPVAD
jgi:hypothetical protein